MKESESKSLPKSSFAEDALAAMIRAQKVAARENARYGMPLIVENPRKAPAKAKKPRRAKAARPSSPARSSE